MHREGDNKNLCKVGKFLKMKQLFWKVLVTRLKFGEILILFSVLCLKGGGAVHGVESGQNFLLNCTICTQRQLFF